MSRRAFGRLVSTALAGLGGLASACSTRRVRTTGPISIAPDAFCSSTESEGFDYIIVGSGAGGGPLAANLALRGYRVCLMEAGGADEPYNVKVPAFHPFATEDERIRWDFFVRHYEDDAKQKADPKFVTSENGVLYPRAATLGGCTAHHAMITVYPHNSDWDHIAKITQDDSWSSEKMRAYFQRLENCRYVEAPSDPSDIRDNPGRHGFSGWLVTEAADSSLLLRDRSLKRIVLGAALETFRKLGRPLSRLLKRVLAELDPNDWRLVNDRSEGAAIVPLATNSGRRTGPRQFLERVSRECPNHLEVKTHCLVTKVLLDLNNRATGVEYMQGPSLYGADPRSEADSADPPTRRLECRREVILAAGTFNTPQILMLSGIGPRRELEKHGIEVRVPLEGVGKNLQDRYEVGVISEMREDFALLRDASLKAPGVGENPDPAFREWLAGEGVYTSNGAVLSIIKRSKEELHDPDLYLFGLAGSFEGYFPGYSDRFKNSKNYFTWAILKGHTQNTAGRVTLRSANPRDVPKIQFHYFDEGNAGNADDLAAVIEGVRYVRGVNARSGGLIHKEIVPGARVKDEELGQFVKNNAWGHHACGTCKIGDEEDEGVLTGDFQVHGTQNLRVVDASVFPRIPGFFIVVPIYMISEKAVDVICRDAQRPATLADALQSANLCVP